MDERVIYLFLGGLFTTAGGFFQNWYNKRSERDYNLRIKREEAYLEYIDALLKLKERHDGSIDFRQYQNKYNPIKAKVILYGSDKVKNRIKEYEAWLYECFEVNFNINDVINEIDNVVLFIRKELNIK
jgi:hypothetical protein